MSLSLDPMLSPATSVASPWQKWLAVCLCVVAAVATGALAPIAASEWPKLPGFVPAYGTAVAFAYLVTAYLLFAQFRTTGTAALVFLAGGCFYTALILLAQLLSFPGLFAPQPILSGGSQTTIWLWAFWHLGPPVYTLAFALHERRGTRRIVGSGSRNAVLAGVFGMVAAVLGASLMAVTVFHDSMPVLDTGGSYVAMNANGVAPAIQALSVAAFLALWWVTRFRTTLQVWMGVAVFALLLDNTITMMGGARFTVGWYVGRLNALLSALVLLAVYLRHIGVLQARLAGMAAALAEDNDALEARVADRTRDLVRAVEERERALAAAQRANASKSRFFASASHDLRQPFQSIRLFHHLLQQEAAPSLSAKFLKGLDTAIAAGEELLHSLLEVSSLEAGVAKLDSRRICLRDILEEVVLDSRGAAEQAGVGLRLHGRSLWVETDPVLLKRAIRNLVVNAIRFNRAHGKVLLGCRVRGGTVMVEVWDTGTGMPADTAEDIFEEYVQLGNPERDRRKGLGLGLAIVRLTADRLGGRVAFLSREGRGSVFRLSLPLAAAPDVHGDPPAAPAGAIAIRNAPSVLLVEDDQLQAIALSQALESWGCRVVHAATADQALQIFMKAQTPPGLLITDFRLPGGLNGIELAARLRRDAGGAIPAIIVTGETDREALKVAFAIGHRVLHKPYQPEDLRDAIRQAAEQPAAAPDFCLTGVR